MSLEAEAEAAGAAADAAGAVIRRFFRAGVGVETKTDASPVTEADKGAEAAIRAVLHGRFPGHGMIGEEMGGQGADKTRFTWVIDPIDGTRAFITGRPTFATLISLLDDGVPVLGLIDQPISGERWLAVDGKLSFTGRYGGVAGVRRVPALAEAELSCTSPEMLDAGQTARFGRLSAVCRRVSWGGDAYAYGLLALGQIDVVAEAGLKVWDWAALVPVIEAAGGVATDWQGRRMTMDSDGSMLAIANSALQKEALAALG